MRVQKSYLCECAAVVLGKAFGYPRATRIVVPVVESAMPDEKEHMALKHGFIPESEETVNGKVVEQVHGYVYETATATSSVNAGRERAQEKEDDWTLKNNGAQT